MSRAFALAILALLLPHSEEAGAKTTVTLTAVPPGAVINGSPDISVICDGATPPICTVSSVEAIKDVDGINGKIDSGWIGWMINRTAAAAMKDALPAPAVLGNGVSFTICNQTDFNDVLTAPSAVLNGSSTLTILPWQCAPIASNGTKYIVALGLPAPPPPAVPPSSCSPDGSVLQSGAVGALGTAAGTWTFITNNVLLNGKSTGGMGSKMEVANSCKLYVDGTDKKWWKWTGAWTATGVAETLAPPP
jgi:hypothetical protein